MIKLSEDKKWWIDENNNRWDAQRYTEEQAEYFSNTLKHCTDCSNCKYCVYCKDCTVCISCHNCQGCQFCVHCDECSGCVDCTSCTGCESCEWCRHCSGCEKCKNCWYCNRCKRFESNPQRVHGCELRYADWYPMVYWLEAGKEQCVVGEFRGTLSELEAFVQQHEEYDQTQVDGYLKFIKGVRSYQAAYAE